MATTGFFTGWYCDTDTSPNTYYYYATAQTIAYSDLLSTDCQNSTDVPTPARTTITGILDNVRIYAFDCAISVSEGQITTVKLNLSLANATGLIATQTGYALYAAPLSTIGSIGT